MKRNPETLIAVGLALYGPHYQKPMSDALGVSDRTMRRWLADDRFTIPDGVWPELATLCRKRGKALEEIAKQIS